MKKIWHTGRLKAKKVSKKEEKQIHCTYISVEIFERMEKIKSVKIYYTSCTCIISPKALLRKIRIFASDLYILLSCKIVFLNLKGLLRFCQTLQGKQINFLSGSWGYVFLNMNIVKCFLNSTCLSLEMENY